MFARWWVIPSLVLLLFLSGCTAPVQDTPEAPDKVMREIGGGTASYDARLQPGERFLKQVPAPSFDHEEDPETETPGDGHDDGLLITQRRQTSRDHYDYPLTGGLRLTNVHGTAENPICICDATFVLWNVSAGFDPTRPVQIEYSSHVLIDNITIYSGSMWLQESDNITITRSLFLDGRGVTGEHSWDIVVRDNDFIHQRSPLNIYDHPPAHTECWPNFVPTCGFNGVEIAAGGRYLVEHNYVDGEGGIGGTGDTEDVRIRHNTLYNGGRLLVGNGETEVSWNLVRGWGQHGVHVAGSTKSIIANNSIIFHTEIDLGDRIFDQAYGTYMAYCADCIVENNDYIGYGAGAQANVMAQALRADHSTVRADDNYWATLHDPRIPPGTWIETRGSTVLTLDSWDLEPNHPLSVGLFLNQQDTPYYFEAITGHDWPLA